MRSPLKRPKPLIDFERQRAVAKQLDLLLDRAGVKERYESEERVFEPDWFADRHLPPLFTNARRVAEKNRQRANKLMFKDGVRQIVFAIPDESLRKEIITCHRKLDAMALDAVQREFGRALSKREMAGYIGRIQIFNQAVMGALVVLTAWYWGDAKWGTAAAAFVIIVAVYEG